MPDLSPALSDPDLGFTSFTVLRTVYRRQNGTSVPAVRELPASGCIHPGTPEMLRLLPEENHPDFALSTGENDGGADYTVPDRIRWNGETWRVVRVRSWAMFGYYQGLAVKMHE